MRVKVGQIAPQFTAANLDGRPITLSRYYGQHVLLSFSRAAVCPLCNVRMQLLIERYPRYQAQGLQVLAFFESSPELARQYLTRLAAPFPLLPDLQGEVYDLYGLETSWLGTARGAMRRSVYREARRLQLGIWQRLRGFLAMDGRKFRMPAEFLIGPEQRIRLVHYGHDAGDFLLFSELEHYLARIPPLPPTYPRPAYPPAIERW